MVLVKDTSPPEATVTSWDVSVNTAAPPEQPVVVKVSSEETVVLVAVSLLLTL